MPNKDSLQIFLTDDDEDDIMLFKDALSECQFQTTLTVFRQGKEVCEFIQDSVLIPDIVFLDINMPLMNGKDCLAALRKDRNFDNTPIIMYSTSANETDIEDCFIRGANLYVQKAFSFMSLHRMIDLVLSSLLNGNLHHVTRDNFVFSYDTQFNNNRN